VTATAPILAPEHQAALADVAASRVLLAFDYDGTLAPIAGRPEDAHMRPSTRRLLGAVARVYPTVVISGRALADVTAMLRRVPLWSVYGNHGLEPLQPGAISSVREWATQLQVSLPKVAGVRLEDKGYSLTVHYRGVRDRARTLAAIDAAIDALPDVFVLQGKEALNLLPTGLGDKGVALTEALERFACERALFVGDEDTDEPAFAAGHGRTLGIRVEPSERSAARYHLGSQLEIDRLLRRLLDFRQLPLHRD